MNRISLFRGKKGLTSGELAERIKVSKQTMSAYENSMHINSLNDLYLLKIAKELEVTPCELLGIDNLKFKPRNKEECDYVIGLLEEYKLSKYGR